LTNLSISYDLYKLVTPPDDRSSFIEIADQVTKALQGFESPAVLIGDSFGGLLASYVASTPAKVHISSLVLINPATSYARTFWSWLEPILTSTGPAFSILGPAIFTLSVAEPPQVARILQIALKSVRGSPEPTKQIERIYKLVLSFIRLLPKETVEWRVTRWLDIGNRLMQSRFSSITTPTLLVIGINDRMLPSVSEGYRLESQLSASSVEVKEYSGKGHLVMDDQLDLLAVLRGSKTLGPPRQLPPIDIAFPTQEEINSAERLVLRRFVQLFSPVFLHKTADSTLKPGIDGVPVGTGGRPVLLVK
jgi:pimeloyl-ACP methyl ester carboxylesterase